MIQLNHQQAQQTESILNRLKKDLAIFYIQLNLGEKTTHQRPKLTFRNKKPNNKTINP